MTNRRKFIAGLGALATGSAAAMGTGAFSSVEANRQVSVDTAGDANAYLGLSGDDEYVSDDTTEGELTIDLGSPDELIGDGFNESAVTTVEEIITVTNQGSEGVRVDFAPDEEKYEQEATVVLDDATVTFMLPSVQATSYLYSGNSMTIDAEVDTTDGAGGNGESNADLTIYAHDHPQ
ncbi:hypothetical protein [Halorubrum sp. HHNYT27]|uniref:hypothetical protein n=1 Tax=Halorubrum sp. HHNYT27 TaxID=3402275 RepID=UPI003EBF0949